jgi:hypothetical protein
VRPDESLRHRVSNGDDSAGRLVRLAHPPGRGATFVAIAQGEGTIYRVVGSSCTSEKIGVGTGFAQMPTELHVVRNEGTVPFVVYTLYVLPRGTPNTGIRIDQPQPSACPDIN